MATESERIKHLLWLLMEHHIVRYLIANTHGRCDGFEKATHHVQLSYIYVASHKFCEIDVAGRIDSKSNDTKLLYMVIHDATQKLTDHMETVIDFPVFDKRPPYEELVPKFFEEFIRLADIAYAKDEKG